MEHKSSNFRLFNCFSFSVLLHSLLIVGLGFASSIMLLKKGTGDGEGKTIEVAVVGDQASAIEPSTPVDVTTAPQPQVETTPAPAVETPAPVVVEAPKEPKEKATKPKKQVAQKPAIKQEVAPQPAIMVNETMNESPVVTETQTEVQEVDEADLAKAEETVATQEVAPQEPQLETTTAATTEQTTEQSATATNSGATTEQTGDTDNAGGDNGNDQKTSIASESSPQNFLSLRQAPGNRPPKYTEDMRIKRLEGRGQLQYYVTRQGTVSDIKVTQSTGHEELDRAAIEAFSQYKFIPGQEGYTVHNFEFTLKGPAEPASGRLRTTYRGK